MLLVSQPHLDLFYIFGIFSGTNQHRIKVKLHKTLLIISAANSSWSGKMSGKFEAGDVTTN